MVPACDRPRPLYVPPSFYHLSAVYASPVVHPDRLTVQEHFRQGDMG